MDGIWLDFQKHKIQQNPIIVREGLVVYMRMDTTLDSMSETCWEKCRLLLLQSTSEDDGKLQFFIPPKTKKPKFEVLCCSISQIRATTMLELPDQDTTFVIKEDKVDYIVQTKGEQDMVAWINSIKSVMNETENKSRRSSSGSSDSPPDQFNFTDLPWFHGNLSRNEAAELVVRDGFFGHGRFLLRESATRRGEYVVTFNFEGRPKHLRVNINEEGNCRVQHFWFKTVLDMIEYFKVNSIPLESEGSPVVLTEFVLTPSTPSAH